MSYIPRVDLFYDCVSPYSWLAIETIQSYTNHDGPWANRFNFHLRPFFLGAVMNATHNHPPASNPVKAKYLLRDVKRCAALCGQVAKFPKDFPTNTLISQRVLTAQLAKYGSNDAFQFALRLSRAYFVESRAISDVKVIAEILSDHRRHKVSEKEILEMASELSVKNLLKQETDAAVKVGAFGAPTILVYVHGEDKTPVMLFGNDRWEHFAMLLQLPWKGYALVKNPVSPQNFAKL